MKAKIVFYHQERLNQNEKYQLRKALLGADQKSNYGNYQYRIKGLVDKIPSYRPVNSSIIVLNEDLDKVINILNKFKIKNETFSIEIQKSVIMK